MMPITNIDEFKRYLVTFSKYKFKAILLATQEDEAVVSYFSRFPRELDEATGEVCLLFVFDETRQAPPSGGVAYQAARLLGIPIDKLPCLIIFDRIECSTEDLVIVPIPRSHHEITGLIRRLITIMEKCKNLDDRRRMAAFRREVGLYRIQSVVMQNFETILRILFQFAGLVRPQRR
jgi:hypothetical protein